MEKKLKTFGISDHIYVSPEDAIGQTYTTRDGEAVPTPLIFPDNPFNEDIKNAKHILDVGCGIGRNLSWIMENTNAHYYGFDPNESMLKWFWDVQDKKYESRVTISEGFINPLEKYNVVVCTFVFQHIGYRPPEDIMNVGDITAEIKKNTSDGCIWILYEHDAEERWIEWWLCEQEINPDVYIRNYKGIEQLTHRDDYVAGDMYDIGASHNLIIWKEKK